MLVSDMSNCDMRKDIRSGHTSRCFSIARWPLRGRRKLCPAEVAHFPASPRQANLKPRAALATHSVGFPPAPPPSTKRARKARYLLVGPIPTEGGGAGHENSTRDVISLALCRSALL